jgi:peroxiredoxin
LDAFPTIGSGDLGESSYDKICKSLHVAADSNPAVAQTGPKYGLFGDLLKMQTVLTWAPHDAHFEIPMPRRLRPVPLMAATLLAASALIVALAIRHQSLTEAYRTLRLRTSLPSAGAVVPTFRARTLAGDSITIGEDPDPLARQVLFVLTTSCPFCRQTLPTWARIADSVSRLSQGHVVVAAISLDSLGLTEDYVRQHQLRYPVVLFPAKKLRRLYRASFVPQTLVLDHEGRILYARTGLLEPQAVVDSVFAALSRPLPTVAARP